MKKRFLFLLAVVIATQTFAQMQVWSNGTIIFSHDQTNVDSISFGNPMQVQTQMQSAFTPGSLAGNVYVSSLSGGVWRQNSGSSGTTSATSLSALCFLDDTNGYYAFNGNGLANNESNQLIAFTYTISGSDITISMNGANKIGKLIGRNGIVISNWWEVPSGYSNTGTYPATFVNYNR